jgi:putative ABC transport system permease protein
VLKVLGADRMMILRGLAIEYGILSLAGAGLGAVLGLPAAWFLVTGILHADWHFAPLSAGLTLLAGAGTTLLVALLGSLPVFAAKPAIWLRSE